MGITFNFEMGNRPNRLGKYSIYLRVTQAQKLKRVKTPVELSRPSDWNPKRQRVRTSEMRHAKYNEILDKFLDEAKTIYADLMNEGTATAENVISRINNPKTTHSFLAYASEIMNTRYNSGRFENAARIKSSLKKIEEYLRERHPKKSDLLFSEITPAFCADFAEWLKVQPNKRYKTKSISTSTIEGIFVIMRMIINRAIRIDGIMKMDDNPFLRFSIPRGKGTKEKLTEGEISRIASLDLPPAYPIGCARDMFLFSYYCAGIRISDCILMRWRNITPDGRLVYTMGKNRKQIDMKLPQQAEDLLSRHRKKTSKQEDFIFHLSKRIRTKATTPEERDTLTLDEKKALHRAVSTARARIARHIRIIAGLAGIDKHVSFHVARHSFAYAAKQKGIDNLIVKSLLAHSSLSTTERYMGTFDKSTVDNALTQVFDAQGGGSLRREILKKVETADENELLQMAELLKM